MTAMASVAARAQEARKGLWLMVAGGVILGTLGVFVEEAGQHPLLTVWFRCTFGALALLAWGVATGAVRDLGLDAKGMGITLLCGGLMLLNWGLFFAAIARTSIAVATVVFHIQPIWVLLYSALVLRTVASARHWRSVVVALLGLLLTTGLIESGALHPAASQAYWLGVLMCLGGSLSYAAVVIIAQGHPLCSAWQMAWWQCVLGAVVLAWTPFVYGWPQELSSVGWLVGLGVVHTGLAYAVIFAGMSRLPLGHIALLQFVYPLVAVAVDWLFYDVVFSTLQVLGFGLMATALWRIKQPDSKKTASENRVSDKNSE